MVAFTFYNQDDGEIDTLPEKTTPSEETNTSEEEDEEDSEEE